MAKEILSLIQREMSGFSKGQKRIANYILSSYDKAAFMTASKLGQTVDVSESTVVRFAAELGYDGYPAMQRALQEMIRNKLTAVQRVQISNDRLAHQDTLSTVLQADIENLRLTQEELDKSAFDQAVQAILRAKRVYILGVRSSSALANFLSFYFNLILEDVTLVHTISSSELFEQIFHINSDDVFIGISFPRYSRRTVRAMRFAKDRGATNIAITDSELSPLSELADHTLMARSDMVSFVDSLTAPLSLVNALIVAVSQGKNEELADILGRLEQVWDEYGVYQKTE